MAITEKSAAKWFDLGIKQDEADLADGEVVNTGCVVPFDGEIMEVWAGTNAVPVAVTLGVYVAAAADVNVLAADTVAINALVAHVGASQTLTTNKAQRKVKAGDILKAVWTITTITAAHDSIFSCMVKVQPSSW